MRLFFLLETWLYRDSSQLCLMKVISVDSKLLRTFPSGITQFRKGFSPKQTLKEKNGWTVVDFFFLNLVLPGWLSAMFDEDWIS